MKTNARPMKLKAKPRSSLPVFYEVDYGPGAMDNGVLKISEIRPSRYPFLSRLSNTDAEDY